LKNDLYPNYYELETDHRSFSWTVFYVTSGVFFKVGKTSYSRSGDPCGSLIEKVKEKPGRGLAVRPALEKPLPIQRWTLKKDVRKSHNVN